MTLKENEYETLECQRKNNVYSETILTESVIGRHNTWEYSRLSQNKTKEHDNLQSRRKTTLITRDDGENKVEVIC